MPDQAHDLRNLVRQAVAADAALAPGATIIAISGARPDIGASTAARGVAAQLAQLGHATILIEANLAPTHPLRSCDQAWSGRHSTLSNVLDGSRRAIETLIDAAENLRVLPGSSAAALAFDAQSLQRFADELAALARHADYILIDAGHGMNAWIDRLWQLASQVLLVATPDSGAVLDAYAAVKRAQFHRIDGRLRLLFSRCDDADEAAPWSARFNDTCARFLFITPKPPVTLAKHSAGGVADADSTRVPCPHRYSEVGMRTTNQDGPFTRSARLLAADLIAEARALKLPARVSRDAVAERTEPATWPSLEPPCKAAEIQLHGAESRHHIESKPASTRFFPDL